MGRSLYRLRIINIIAFRETMGVEIPEEIGQNALLPTSLPGQYIFGASVIGPSHIDKGTPCQDACKYAIIPPNLGVIAVADGLGSASKSDTGAQVAVEAALEEGKATITKKKIAVTDLSDVAKEAVAFARKELEAKATKEQCSLHDLACTIIVVIFHEDSVSVAHIGDGAVVAKTEEGLRLISAPGDSEYVNEVIPLTTNDWEQSLRITPKISGVECVAVFTDGCQRAALLRTQNGLQPYDRFFEPLFSYAQELEVLEEGEQDIRDFLASQKMSEHSEDDKTLVIAALKKEEGLR
ncbi:MAG: protein phosphatase 2C domain-containing protein [Proteobacteria bacterium]|nr:protein phosphatase 2C domain-containing protein [Pseudomonadota bacterium]